MLRSSRATSSRTSLLKVRRAPATFQHNLFFIILAVVLWGSLFSLDIRGDAFSVYLPTTISFVLVGIVSFLGLYDAARERAFSLNTSHWTYVVFFLFYAPFIQFLVQESSYQSDVGLFDKYALWVNCATLIWCGLYSLFYGSSVLNAEPTPPPTNKPRYEYICSNWTYLFTVALCIMALGLLVMLLGLEVLLLRGAGSQISGDAADKSTFLIVNSMCRGIPVAATGLLMLTRGKSKWVHWSAFTICALITFTMNNPIAIARFWFGSILIGFCCLYFHMRKIRMTGLWISLALTLAGLTIFPLLSATRNVTSADQLSNIQFTNDWSTNLTDADFDGYSMVAASMEWATREGASNGYQLMGNTLFWVPRMFWYDKPLGSGQMVAEYFDMVNTNMAEPMTAEAFVNFGWLGIPIFAFGFARLFSYFDRRYWGKGQKNLTSVLGVTYPFLTALTIYFLRGDYLSGLSSSLSLLGSSIFIIWIFQWTSRKIPATP